MEDIVFTADKSEMLKNYVSSITDSPKGSKDWKKKAGETNIKVRQLINRYGDDGFGNKPEDMNRVEYWLGHIEL